MKIILENKPIRVYNLTA